MKTKLLPLILAIIPLTGGTVRADIAQLAYLKASNTGASGDFGRSVAIDGDTMVVGAPNDDGTATNSGAAYVFVKGPSGWVQQAYLKASNAGASDFFGETVAIDGDTIVVGARDEDSDSNVINSGFTNESASLAGAAYVFVRSGTTWSQDAYLKASNSGAGDEFGYSVAISGDTVAVGARYEDSSSTVTDSGAVYVFTRNGSSWTQQQLLRASNAGTNDYFGVSVDIEGDTIIAGAHQEDGTGTDAGAAYVFTRGGSTWSQQQILRAVGGGEEDAFGAEVAISGNSVVIRAALEDGSATTVNGTVNNSAASAGAAYVFTRAGTTWSQQAYLKPSNAEAGDQFGRSLDIEGDTVVVGAPFEDSYATGINGNGANNSALESGAAYVFSRTGTTWTQTAYLKASNTEANDNFGISNTVRLSGSKVIVGAPLEDGGAAGVDGNEADNSLADSGAAYLFDLNAPADIRVEYPAGINLPDSQYTLDFPTTTQAVPVSRILRIRNVGGQPLHVSGMSTTTGFDVTGAALPFVLGPGTFHDVTVRFLANLRSGVAAGTLTLTSNDPDNESEFGISLIASALRGAPVSLDFTFGSGGNLPSGVATLPANSAISVLLQTDGKILAAGTESGKLLLARFNADGSPDASFGTGGRISTSLGGHSYATSLALQGDGKVLVLGNIQLWNGSYYESDFALVRYLPTGALDPAFGNGGIVITDIDGHTDVAMDLVVQPNGRIVVTGYAWMNYFIGTDGYEFATVRYTTTGALGACRTFQPGQDLIKSRAWPPASSTSTDRLPCSCRRTCATGSPRMTWSTSSSRPSNGCR